MQLLPPPVAAIAPDGRLQIAVVFAVEGLAKPAIVYISFAHVLKLARDQFQAQILAAFRAPIGKSGI